MRTVTLCLTMPSSLSRTRAYTVLIGPLDSGASCPVATELVTKGLDRVGDELRPGPSEKILGTAIRPSDGFWATLPHGWRPSTDNLFIDSRHNAARMVSIVHTQNVTQL